MIVRTPKTKNYATIDNRVLEDSRLSWKARGIIAHLLSKPDGWEVMTQQLINAGPDGRDAVVSALKELEKFGYITRTEQPRGGSGRFDSKTTIVHEEPTTGFPPGRKSPGRTGTENPLRTNAQVATDEGCPSTANPLPDNPSTDNPRRVRTELSITEETTTEEGLKTSCVFEKHENAGFEDDAQLRFAFMAVAYTIESLFPEMEANNIDLLVDQVVRLIEVEGDGGEVQFALAAIAERLDNRSWRVGVDLSEPVEKPGFVMGVARQVIENWQRDGVWAGSAHQDLASDWSWNDFVSDFAPAVGRR